VPSSIEEWFTRPRLFVLLGLLIFAGFPGIILGTESLFYRDMGVFGYPLAHYHRDAFWRGEIPLWNPLSNCGVPFLAQWNTLALYPGALLYLLPPLPWSMSLYVFAHVFLAAMGMYGLALRWSGSRFAACVAGLLFAWNGMTLHALMWTSVIAALGWMPWVVLVTERAWLEGGRRHVIRAAVVSAMQMLAGVPEILLLTWGAIGVLWLRDFLRGPRMPAPVARGRLFVRVSVCGVLAGLLCAAQLLPFMELLRASNRHSSFGSDVWAMPLWGWANFFVPLFGCTPSVIGVYSQDLQQWTSSYYAGTATLVLALLAWRSDDSRVKWLAGIGLAGLLFALGDQGLVYAGIKKVIPWLGFIQFPVKYVILLTFALPLLAAYGVAAWEKGRFADQTGRRWAAGAIGVVLVVIIAVMAWAWIRPLPQTVPGVAVTNGLWRAAFLLAIAGAFAFAMRGGRPGVIARFAILGLLGADMLTHMPRQNPTVANRVFGELPVDMNPPPVPGESRAMLSPPMRRFMESAAVADPFQFYATQRRLLLHNCNLVGRVPKVDGFFPLYVREGDRLIRQLYRSTNYATLPLLDFLGVSQLSSSTEMFLWETRPTAMPLVTCGQAPVFASSPEILEKVFSGDFAPRQTVYLPAEVSAQVNAASNACRVTASEVRAHFISANVEAAAPSLVVLAQTHYPAWRAYVDGMPVAIHRANYACQAVLVPAGLHRVELRYEDRALKVGAWVSLVTLAALIVTWIGIRTGKS
jgi:hypothetical protein